MNESQAIKKSDPVVVMRDPATIRTRAHRLLELGLQGKLKHFAVHMDKLDAVADLVATVVHGNYPALNIPYHGRWRHFSVGGHDRWGQMQKQFSNRMEMVRAAIDLAVVSVLLDAGAGAKWIYREEATGATYGRSEGLAVASFYMFQKGAFSSNPENPLQVDALGLAHLSEHVLSEGFQISADNPMLGLEGRLSLVKNLSKALFQHPEMFGTPLPRPGNLFDYLAQNEGDVPARDILGALLKGFAMIWPGRIMLGGQNLGDVWTHSQLPYQDPTDQLMPFHKLSQWLTYSLLEPFEWAGRRVIGLNELTGLAEYRNGGLFIDTGLLELRDPHQAEMPHKPADELIVEWRALTIALLDRLRLPVAEKLGLKPEDFPLARLLEGGTWLAGRKIAMERRPSGDPPVRIISDGTVF
jgi:hypothetical protein